MGGGLACGFRLEGERESELDLVLYFGRNVGTPIRTLFQSLFESFLDRPNLKVLRFDPVVCSKRHPLNRAVLRERAAASQPFAFCPDCGEKLALPKADQPIQLTRQQQADVDEQRRGADQRSRFEQVLFRLKTYVVDRDLPRPECFISYAWGQEEYERWAERLANDLLKADVNVILDRWENARIGMSVPRFVERAQKADYVIVIGTPLYRRKYDNKEPMRGFVVAAEGDIIGKRMIGTEARKQTVLPLLLEGDEESAFPPLLHGRTYGDFRSPDAYFISALELILSLYEIPRAVADDLRGLLRGESRTV
ncbi:MAG TPA: toll/interleukin-1 receptor domain-containing protein [Thermoanaerobaculia bacterium]